MPVTCAQMAEAEKRLFATGVSAESLMNEAGEKCFRAIERFFPQPARAAVFCGKGNNGGDALVVARLLSRAGWKVEVEFSHGREGLSELGTKKLSEYEAESATSSHHRESPLVLVDGLLGIGASGALRGEIRTAAERRNAMRLSEHGTCFAIDIPRD